MKIGMNLLLWTTFVEDQHAALLAELKEAGFDGVEVPIGAGDAVHYTKLKSRLDGLGLECTTVVAVDAEHDPISPEPAVREKARTKLCEMVDLSHVLGSPTLCGPYHSAYKHFAGRGPSEDEMKWSAEVLRSVGEYAESAGVTLALEPLNRFETYLLNTAAQARRYLDLVAHPRVKILYDTHHGHIEEKSPTEAIRTLGDGIGHVHLSENDRGVPGTGQVRWEENLRRLHESGYDGWMVFEAFSRLDADFAGMIHVWRDFSEDPADVYRQGLPFVRALWDRVSTAQ